MQDNIIKFPKTDARATINRSIVMKTIARELYPEDQFPEKNFPDLHNTLFGLFTEFLKKDKERLHIYKNSHIDKQVVGATRDILDFRNLLRHSPKAVVLIYQKYIEKFITYKHSNRQERADIFQEVLTRLFEVKIYKIQQKFDFDFSRETDSENYEKFKKVSSFTSYLMVSVRNIYIDILRERNIRPLTGGDVKEIEDVDVVDFSGGKKMLNQLLIREELLKLQTIFMLFYKTRAKLELCLKLKYRLKIAQADIQRCFPSCSDEDIETLTQDFALIRDKQLFKTILAVFNRNEGRMSKSDSLRKWTNVKVEELIMHLNRTHQCGVYNTKNFADFIALYYQNIKGDQEEAMKGDKKHE